jgi:hypothetical protein
MDLKRITIHSKELFLQYYQYSPPKCSYLSFANLFIWKDAEDISFFECNDLLLVTGKSLYNGKRYFMAPIGKGLCGKVMPMLVENFGDDFSIYGITETDKVALSEKCSSQIQIIRQRDMDNYVYLSEKLINLTGKKLHSKRNHINKFKENYHYTYERLNHINIRELIEFKKNWYLEKELDDTLEMEKKAIDNALSYYIELDLVCGMIKVDGKIVAFSIGEQLNEDTALIHIEKADINYDGSYAVMNNEFVKNEWSHLKYINREDDMGLEGLRKSKLSYQPDVMVEMYSAVVNKEQKCEE